MDASRRDIAAYILDRLEVVLYRRTPGIITRTSHTIRIGTTAGIGLSCEKYIERLNDIIDNMITTANTRGQRIAFNSSCVGEDYIEFDVVQRIYN